LHTITIYSLLSENNRNPTLQIYDFKQLVSCYTLPYGLLRGPWFFYPSPQKSNKRSIARTITGWLGFIDFCFWNLVNNLVIFVFGIWLRAITRNSQKKFCKRKKKNRTYSETPGKHVREKRAVILSAVINCPKSKLETSRTYYHINDKKR
jgi:hypothetical protein